MLNLVEMSARVGECKVRHKAEKADKKGGESAFFDNVLLTSLYERSLSLRLRVEHLHCTLYTARQPQGNSEDTPRRK